jgi:N-acetylglucosaminyldiphosphoundecaprenol N-acetyl-beta-D-mannosaminyltransferase
MSRRGASENLLPELVGPFGVDCTLPSHHILGMRVDATNYDDATCRIVGWARGRESRYVCVASVNNVMQSYDAPAFRRQMNDADLVTPDGMPLVWGLRSLGVPGVSRVRGTNLVTALCNRLCEEGVSVGLYGGTPRVLDDLVAALKARWPSLHVAYAWSPPFRALTDAEDEMVVATLATSPVRVLLVGLSTPTQDEWMASHRGRIPAVMVGVGAAFDFLSGRKRQAPGFMQRAGMEWLFRLVTEPRRLWRRYLFQNPRFLVLFGLQLARARLGQRPRTEQPLHGS